MPGFRNLASLQCHIRKAAVPPGSPGRTGGEPHGATAAFERRTPPAEIKKLEGIIPICTHCRKIRDEEGSGNRLEEYVSCHLDAEFSHGICEKCLEKDESRYLA
jgi:hypothetical protein